MSSEKVLSAETRPSPADDNNESDFKGNSGSSHDSVSATKSKVKVIWVTIQNGQGSGSSGSTRRTRLFIRDLPGDTTEDYIRREVEECVSFYLISLLGPMGRSLRCPFDLARIMRSPRL